MQFTLIYKGEKMIKALIELLKVKTLISLSAMIVFCYLSIVGKIEPKDFMLVLMAIITYYFNKKETI
jgi:hypothetical protein